MTEQETEFMRELRQLLKRHMVRLESSTDYNNEDEPCGDSFYFNGPEIFLNLSNVEAELEP